MGTLGKIDVMNYFGSDIIKGLERLTTWYLLNVSYFLPKPKKQLTRSSYVNIFI